jgi:hypothetical protein
MSFVSVNVEDGSTRETGQPGRRVASVPDAPAANTTHPMSQAEYQERQRQTRVEYRAGQEIDKTTQKQNAINVNEGSSVEQATSLSSVVQDATGDRYSIKEAIAYGFVKQTAPGVFALTEEGKSAFTVAGDAKQNAAPASDDTTTTNTEDDATKDDQPASDFTVSEESQAIIESVGSKVGDSPMLYAIEQSLVEGNMESATKLAQDLASTMGIDTKDMQHQIAVVMSDRINQARSFVTAEIGLDAAELDAYEAHLATDPQALRKVREAIAAGDKATVVRAAQEYAENQLLDGWDVDPVQDLRVDGRSVEGRVYRVGNRYAIELKTGERVWLADQKVSRVEFEG